MRFKHWLMGIVATVAMVVASTGVYPASAWFWYQPELPPELRK
ncbi:MAG: cyclic lactone autoinducer peptide [Bacillota bacterium]